MAIKGGDLIHVGNQILIDRAQTAGPGQVNIPTEKIYELGNYYSIAQVRDIPDLSFSLESFDVSAEFEALLTGKNFVGMANGTVMQLDKSLPLDVASQFKAGRTAPNAYDVIGSVATPYLVLESVSYRFGVTDNASQTATLRGDSIFYTPGSSWIEETAGDGTAGQTVTLTHPAYPYRGDKVAGADRYALSVTLASGKRLSLGADYTEAATGTGDARAVTLTLRNPVLASDRIRVIYSSPTVATYPQTSHEPVSATRPAAIRGRDIEVFVGGTALGDRWTSVQNVTVDYRVTLDKDMEFGNYQVVAQDFDVPEVSGSVELRPRDYRELYNKVAQAAGIDPGAEIIGALSSVPLEVAIVLHSPVDGQSLKTLHVPDARFTLPGFSGTVQQKMNVTLNFDSDEGRLSVVKGGIADLPTP